jgi:hypothetical protein
MVKAGPVGDAEERTTGRPAKDRCRVERKEPPITDVDVVAAVSDRPVKRCHSGAWRRRRDAWRQLLAIKTTRFGT